MSQRATDIANALLRLGVLDPDDPEQWAIREELLGDAVLFVDVRARLDGVGYDLVLYRDLRDHVLSADPSVRVDPWRMDEAYLDRPDTRPLTTEDWAKLHRYLARPEVPLREVAEAMRERGVKIEQEALLESACPRSPPAIEKKE